MIPTHWFRKIVFFLFVMEVGGGIIWVGARLAPGPSYSQLYQTIASIIFLFGFYASGPLMARYLAPVPNNDPVRNGRLARVYTKLHGDRSPLFLYDHKDKEANTVGVLRRHSRVYITTSFVDGLSDAGLSGVLAHELTHVREHHILFLFCYAACFAMGSHLFNSNTFFFAGLFLFLAFRRYFEYRADSGAAGATSRETILIALHELAAMYPPKGWHRWVSWLTAYPTLPMRIQAIKTGYRAIV